VPVDEAPRLQRLAELAVKVGANVQPGQLVVVSGLIENVPLMREIARAAYRAGAHRVEAGYRDMHFTRALIELGPDDALGEWTAAVSTACAISPTDRTTWSAARPPRARAAPVS